MKYDETIAVIGLGYVGLPVAAALAGKGPVIGFDIDATRVGELEKGIDRTGELDPGTLPIEGLAFSTNLESIRAATTYIVTVPTPIDGNRQPDLRPVLSATRSVASVLKKGDLVVYESTVYPGVTEEMCGPLLAELTGLTQGVDFSLGYSPERINPGDRTNRLETITKVVSGDTPESLERVATVYERIIDAGVHRAPTIKVAEAAKVIENTQRDVNIALMNELALIFDRLDIRTSDVLAAAGTKWNFLRFTPGLVGGHCIGVDPYYLTAKAESVGYHPEVILSGRRINDGMGRFIAQKLIKKLIAAGRPTHNARVGVLGLTFKENVPDLRNSRVPDILAELAEFGVKTMVHDPHADAAEARALYGVDLVSFDELNALDGMVLAVSHQDYLDDLDAMQGKLAEGGVLMDVKSVLDPQTLRSDLSYWSL